MSYDGVMARTVLDLSAEERTTIRERLRVHLESEAPARQKRVDARRKAAMKLARAAAAILREEFGATRVSVFGSLARADFNMISDIDLIVWGIPENRRAAAFLEVGGEREEPGSFGPDLVFAENASPELLESVRADHLEI